VLNRDTCRRNFLPSTFHYLARRPSESTARQSRFAEAYGPFYIPWSKSWSIHRRAALFSVWTQLRKSRAPLGTSYPQYSGMRFAGSPLPGSSLHRTRLSRPDNLSMRIEALEQRRPMHPKRTLRRQPIIGSLMARWVCQEGAQKEFGFTWRRVRLPACADRFCNPHSP
jgi:hypothetical protein